MENNIERTPSRSDITIYQTEDGISKVEVLIEGETVWLTQEQMAILYGKSKSTICEHIRNIYEEKELVESLTMHKFGKTEFMDKGSNYYNLDVIIAVGYRVRSVQGTRFRQWATSTLKEYLITGVALNDERFKQGTSMNYFKRLLDRIREIRISEKVFYQQIKDIYKTSIDYDPSDWISRLRMVLTMNEKNILEHSGRISHRMAVEKANTEYQIYNGRLLEEEHLKSIKELSETLATIGQ